MKRTRKLVLIVLLLAAVTSLLAALAAPAAVRAQGPADQPRVVDLWGQTSTSTPAWDNWPKDGARYADYFHSPRTLLHCTLERSGAYFCFIEGDLERPTYIRSGSVIEVSCPEVRADNAVVEVIQTTAIRSSPKSGLLYDLLPQPWGNVFGYLPKGTELLVAEVRGDGWMLVLRIIANRYACWPLSGWVRAEDTKASR